MASESRESDTQTQTLNSYSVYTASNRPRSPHSTCCCAHQGMEPSTPYAFSATAILTPRGGKLGGEIAFVLGVVCYGQFLDVYIAYGPTKGHSTSTDKQCSCCTKIPWGEGQLGRKYLKKLHGGGVIIGKRLRNTSILISFVGKWPIVFALGRYPEIFKKHDKDMTLSYV